MTHTDHVDPDEYLDDDETRDGLDPTVGAGSPDTAPHDLPPPTIPEPVAIGAGVSVAAVVAALISADVPWYGAVGLAALLVLVAAWQRQHVTPSR